MLPTTPHETSLMRTIAFTSFPQDEQDRFRSSCRWWRKKPDDFVVKAEEPDMPPGPPAPTERDVIVVHKPTGKGRRYGAGSGTNWILKFEDDIQAGYFRSPS